MREKTLVRVRERLLGAGIAPRHVNRYITELRDHLTDLVTQGQAAGLDLPAAEAKALSLLGTEAQLVQAMIDRGAPRSLAASAPWAVFGILPLVAMVVVTMLLATGAFILFAPYRDLAGTTVPPMLQAGAVTLTVLGSYLLGPLLAGICIVVALRQRLASRWVWVGLALIALVSGPLGVHIATEPEGGMRGSVLQVVRAAGGIDAAGTLAVMATRTAILFAASGIALWMLRRPGQVS